MLRETDF